MSYARAYEAPEGVPSEEPNPDDMGAALVRMAVAGEPEAVRKLLARLAPEFRRVCRAVFGSNSSDVEDSLQEGLVAFVRALPNFRFESPIRHYALRIALRSALKARRRSREHYQHLDPLATLAEATGRQPLPSEEAAAAGRRAALRALLDRLPEEQAEALTLYVVLGCSLDETATLVGVSPNTVKTRIRLGKNSLRRTISRNPALRSLLGEPP